MAGEVTVVYPRVLPSDLENGRFERNLGRIAPEQCRPLCSKLGSKVCELASQVRSNVLTTDEAVDAMLEISAENADCPGRYGGPCSDSDELDA